MYGLLVCGLFSNSFVVNESSLIGFCVTTSVTLHAYVVLVKSGQEERRGRHFLLALVLMGLTRFVTRI